MPETTETKLARMEEILKAVLLNTAEMKASIECSSASASEAVAKAALAQQNAEDAKRTVQTAFTRIDEGRSERAQLTEFANQLKGAGKAAVAIVGFFQVLIMAMVIWLVSSVSTLRESRAVLEYRVQQLETKCSSLK